MTHQLIPFPLRIQPGQTNASLPLAYLHLQHRIAAPHLQYWKKVEALLFTRQIVIHWYGTPLPDAPPHERSISAALWHLPSLGAQQMPQFHSAQTLPSSDLTLIITQKALSEERQQALPTPHHILPDILPAEELVEQLFNCCLRLQRQDELQSMQQILEQLLHPSQGAQSTKGAEELLGHLSLRIDNLLQAIEDFQDLLPRLDELSTTHQGRLSPTFTHTLQHDVRETQRRFEKLSQLVARRRRSDPTHAPLCLLDLVQQVLASLPQPLPRRVELDGSLHQLPQLQSPAEKLTSLFKLAISALLHHGDASHILRIQGHFNGHEVQLLLTASTEPLPLEQLHPSQPLPPLQGDEVNGALLRFQTPQNALYYLLRCPLHSHAKVS
uniref:Uncharacterized protein n=1 Tax=Magnetococcus massalia (strain MO-1) TaxID=451514 RepID=A0A1S7LIV4_MAGMO|nr:conserved protein of unknown function [Candidatus Magnetococcus massalia]